MLKSKFTNQKSGGKKMKNIFNKKPLHKTVGIILFMCFNMITVSSHAQSSMVSENVKGNLIQVSWLEKNFKNSDLVLLDASPSQIYNAKHIPGALNYDIFTYGIQELPIKEIEKRYQSWGISPGKKIVIYDQGGTYFATRLFFSLDYYGFPAKDILILDGGLSKWQEAGLPVTSEISVTPEKGVFTIKKLNESVRTDLPEFLNASANTDKNVLLEALDPNWHFGELNAFGKPGHIPNAIMLPAADFYNADKTFKSTAEIKKTLDYLGIKPEQNVYSHCGGGIAASVPFFALKYLLDYPNVKLFPGSLLEYATDQRDLPLWTYDAPGLLRETSWLQGWGGRMMRMYGISHISIIDIRPADVFADGHVPYAVNINADVFKNSINRPEKLTEIIGPAGVSPQFESVIFSGKGLTKEAALAFVLLERLGQKKVSVFIDDIDAWVQSGSPVIKDSITKAASKTPQDLIKPTKIYPVNLQQNLIITDLKNTQGLYSKVFLASGKNLPTKAQNGKIVHVPYTDLLNVDGRPKPAKNIWNMLEKAGVPRYAEIICYSDDPGEAAANYFILKLMGYPDIKILVN